MKIYVLVQACNKEPFLSNAKHIVTSYQRIVRNLSLPIKCYYFTGNETDMTYFNKDNISLAFSDSETSVKEFSLLHAMLTVDYMDFDILVQTNASTVLNIVKLYDFICNEYDRQYVYCNGIVNRWHTGFKDLAYPNGNFWMCSKNICNILYDNWEKSKEDLLVFSRPNQNEGTQNELMWYGVAEDLVIGNILNENNIPVKRIGNFLSFRDTLFDNMDYMKPNIYDYIGVYAKTHVDDIKSRGIIEPVIIEFLSLLFEKHACISET